MPAVADWFSYAQQGREIEQIDYSDGTPTSYTDVGPAPAGYADGTIINPGTLDGGTNGGVPAGTSSGVVSQGFNIFGVGNPISLTPLFHSKAAWVIGAGLVLAYFATKHSAGGRSAVGF